jgi:hypothetical protein
MKNYAGNRTLLIDIQAFFLIFIGFILTSICLSASGTTKNQYVTSRSNTIIIK